VRTLADVGDLAGKRVLVRVDFNVPLKAGEITDDTRIRAALPTLEYLRERGARLILVAHMGRPVGGDPALSLLPVAQRLAQLIAHDVELVPAVVGEQVAQRARAMENGDVLLLENVRFEQGETTNDPALARELASLAEIYVNDAFGAAHRAHASTHGVALLVADSVAGLLLQREVEQLASILADPGRPLVAIVGGAKVTDKIAVIERFLELADSVLIGGAMCFPFLRAQGHAVGNSLCEAEGIEPARSALARPGTRGALCRRYRFADARRRGRAGRLDGSRHRPAHGRPVLRADQCGGNGLLERTDGRIRAGAVRGGHAHGRRSGRSGAGDNRRGRRRLGCSAGEV